MDKLSYSLGVSVGANLKQQGFKPEILDDFVEGLKDVLQEQSLKISETEVNKIVTAYFKDMQEQGAKENQKAQEQFFSENLQKDGVKQTGSGLQYELIKEGQGDPPKAESTVSVHYHGMFLDGKVFDSSVERGKPVSFPVNGVIQGWQEALQMMKPGGKMKLYIPSELAYGSRGAGNAIPPHTPLMFDVELLEVEKY
jgi:FKBP-type peptidyl-prolyl cis-trans isomerase FklB